MWREALTMFSVMKKITSKSYSRALLVTVTFSESPKSSFDSLWSSSDFLDEMSSHSEISSDRILPIYNIIFN